MCRTIKNSRAPGLLEKFFARFPLLRCDVRALAVKDLRMFWRDTTQWGQSVMFFGLLGAYIINLRNFTHQLTSPFWINAVAFLNLGACAFNLASVTTRFVFPNFRWRAGGCGLSAWRLWGWQRGQNQILAGEFALASRHARPRHAVMLSAEYVLGATWPFSARSSP